MGDTAAARKTFKRVKSVLKLVVMCKEWSVFIADANFS
jgi:hypothetical protein